MYVLGLEGFNGLVVGGLGRLPRAGSRARLRFGLLGHAGSYGFLLGIYII